MLKSLQPPPAAWIGFVATVAVALLAVDARAQTGPRRIFATAYPLHIDDFTLTSGQTVEYRTSATTAGVDPVMHLLRLDGSSWTHITSNDNFVGLGLESRIQHTNGTGTTKRYLSLVKGAKAMFFPHADGAPDFVFGANSDFRVMEDELCRLLRFSGPVGLGDANTVCLPFSAP